MTNHDNHSYFVGKVNREIQQRQNSDGSRTLLVVLNIERNYADMKSGKKPVDFIQLETHIPADQPDNGIFAQIAKGDKVSVIAEVQSSQFSQNGEMRYVQYWLINSIEILEKAANGAPVENVQIAV